MTPASLTYRRKIPKCWTVWYLYKCHPKSLQKINPIVGTTFMAGYCAVIKLLLFLTQPEIRLSMCGVQLQSGGVSLGGGSVKHRAALSI